MGGENSIACGGDRPSAPTAAGRAAPRPNRGPFRRQGQARHLSAHGRRAVANGPLRLQAQDERMVRQGLARFDPSGPAIDDHDLRPDRAFRSRPRSTNSPSTASRACGSASCCPSRPGWPTTSASSAACGPTRSITSRRSPRCRPATRSQAGPAWAPGRRTDLGRSRTTCRRSWSWWPGPRTPSRSRRSRRGSGRRATCRASTRAWRSARPAIRSSTSTTPRAFPPKSARRTLDGLKALNEITYRQVGDPETHTRIQQYELAFRMQSSVPELVDLAQEPPSTYSLYGDEAKKAGSFTQSVLLARRMVERGVRFIQIYHNNWDTHANVAGRLPSQCKDVDQACYALVQDLKRRGSARPDVGYLGRRIRPHDLLPRPVEPRQLRPRPSPPLLYHVDGRRRHQRGRDLRRDRRLLLQHREGPGPRSRFSRHRAAPPGLRPPTIHVPRSRAGPTTDRSRTRPGRT